MNLCAVVKLGFLTLRERVVDFRQAWVVPRIQNIIRPYLGCMMFFYFGLLILIYRENCLFVAKSSEYQRHY